MKTLQIKKTLPLSQSNLCFLPTILFCTFFIFTSCKKEKEPTPEPIPTFTCGVSTITDCQGNIYNTVKIGSQCWTKQNMKATKYDTNSERPNVNITTSQEAVFTPYYTISGLNHQDAGNLYNWAAAVALENGENDTTEFLTKRQGICPNGWHLPTNAEWNILADFLGDQNGGQMKTTDTTYWKSPNYGATNSSGFSALPAGRAIGNNTSEVRFRANFWTASKELLPTESFRGAMLDYTAAYLFAITSVKTNHCFSVRCIRD